jgi:xanthine dehydrogenase YagS FAD-binding subunit
MNRFSFVDCTTVEHALAELGSGAEVKAGGIDVLDRLKEGLDQPEKLVNIRNVRDLSGIEQTSDGLRVGPLVTLAEISEHAAVKQSYAAVAHATGHAATPQIRNVATMGGNLLQRPRCWYFRDVDFPCRRKGGEICFAQDGENQYHAIFDNHICAIVAPSSAAVPLIAFNAQIELTSKDGKRTVPLEKFYLTPEQNVTREHSLRTGELLTAIVIPRVPAEIKSAYQKYAEKDSHDWPIADAAVVLQMDGNTVRNASIVLGAAAPTPMRATGAEAILKGKVLNEELARQAGKAAMDGATPLAHNAYKVNLFETAIYRTILYAAGLMPRDRSAVGGNV